MSTVASAFLWINGMVTTFDQDGRQVPAYQGKGTEVIPKLRRDYPDLVVVGADWDADMSGGILNPDRLPHG